MVEQKVAYMLEVEGKFILVADVPASVCLETGERLFLPETVERLQQTIWGKRKSPYQTFDHEQERRVKSWN